MTELNGVIAPSPDADWTELEGEVQLARTKQGRIFEKHILSYGELLHPVTGTKIKIDGEFAKVLKANFDASVCDIVQVPLANDQNDHVESPGANLGEVLGLRVDDKAGKIYAQIDARQDAEKFGKTYLGASAFMHLNYTDTKTGKKAGPTLLHVAVTNRPYVTGLDSYEEIVAASAEYTEEPALLQLSAASDQEEAAVPRTLEEILAELKADHEIDVTALQEQLSSTQLSATETEAKLTAVQGELAAKPDVEELAEKVRAALVGSSAETKLSNTDTLDPDTIVAAVGELAQQNVRLTSAGEQAVERIAALEKRNVEAEVDGLIQTGYIVPAKKDVYLGLALSNREAFDALIPEEPVVKLSVEKGTAPTAEQQQKQETDVEAELARLLGTDGPAAQYLKS